MSALASEILENCQFMFRVGLNSSLVLLTDYMMVIVPTWRDDFIVTILILSTTMCTWNQLTV